MNARETHETGAEKEKRLLHPANLVGRERKQPFAPSLPLVCFMGLFFAPCKRSNNTSGTVVVYTSVDDVFARPIAEKFQRETGIEVKLVPDTEETKSTGLLNRLIAEKERPQADVFWSGDPVRAAVLKARGISAPFKPANPADTQGRFSDPAGHWSALSARARVLTFNTNLVPAGQEPKSLKDFLNAKWKAKACLANPLFGTTSMQPPRCSPCSAKRHPRPSSRGCERTASKCFPRTAK